MNSTYLFRLVPLLTTLLISVPNARAQHLVTGIVRNGTTGAPAVGDQVVLLHLSRAKGMVEVSRSRSDNQGSFVLPLGDSSNAYVIRVLHGGAIYDRVPTSFSGTDLTVFDTGSKVNGISGYASIVKLQSDGSSYSVTELHAIQNNSYPPRTQLSSRNLELKLPSQSHLDSITVVGPDAPISLKVKPAFAGTTTFDVGFPLRPGMTQYAVRYHLPAARKIVFHSRILYPTQQWTGRFSQYNEVCGAHAGQFSHHR